MRKRLSEKEKSRFEESGGTCCWCYCERQAVCAALGIRVKEANNVRTNHFQFSTTDTREEARIGTTQDTTKRGHHQTIRPVGASELRDERHELSHFALKEVDITPRVAVVKFAADEVDVVLTAIEQHHIIRRRLKRNDRAELKHEERDPG